MAQGFQSAYKELNDKQKQAVDRIEGPMLVIAGPGTGKTRLLSTRVANMLNRDVSPGNILCLTFTDNAARNMRERMITIIGQPAYHVAIHTFHSFGSDIINQYPDFFTGRQLIQQIDDLGRYELLQEIFETLPHSNPLSVKVGDNFVFLKNTLDIISWLKQNAVSPSELHEILNANEEFIESIAEDIAETFRLTPSAKQLPAYEKILKKVQEQITGKLYFGFPEYASQLASDLERAIADTVPSGPYAKSITAWRKAWCKKDAAGRYVCKDGGQSYRKMHAVANVYKVLIEAMSAQGLYDFDDMVTLAVHAMETNDELRYNLQERFQYVLVDEFQDTNKAQLRMLNALGDNPVHEGRPNLMAVGDDDQAIYAFQGAETSNMAAFARQYSLEPIVLSENWRSSAEILDVSSAVADQIEDRLESIVPGANKELLAKKKYPETLVEHLQFTSELAQYDWVASEAENLIKTGVKPENIAVIAPRHKYLERLMPYLGARKLPVAYERRENVLEAPIIIELLTMAELITAIAENRQDDVDALIGQVLGYDFWNIPPETLTRVSLDAYNQNKHWLELLSKQKDGQINVITAWFVRLAKRSRLEPLEYMLDKLLGGDTFGVDSEYDQLVLPQVRPDEFVSPMKSYYFSSERYDSATDTYLTLLGQLSTLRHRLRQWKPNQALYIKDFVAFAGLHRQAGLKIVDSHPHTQSTNAVQVMTAYKAKGLEFDAVFVINVQDEVWGSTARSQTSRISLPHNLPIQPAGDNDNDRLRLLFVAMTRAKHRLHLTGYSNTLDNKPSPNLSYIADIPELQAKIIDKPDTVEAAEILATDWAYRFRQVIADKPSLFEPILEEYKLSVTHLNNFIDLVSAGPEYFLIHNLLRFPEAPSPSAAYGDAIHKTLQWIQSELKTRGRLPEESSYQAYFSDMLRRKHLLKSEQNKLDDRGKSALAVYIKRRGPFMKASDVVERGFHNEGVVVHDARLSGKIDKLSFPDAGRVQVIDFKTGKPATDWRGKDEFEKMKLHKYRQQLLFYKLLVESSASYSQKLTVTSGALEFIETNEQGELVDNLSMSFDEKELSQFSKLIGAVWQHIQALNFPDVDGYDKNLKGIKQFEQDLIDGKI